MSTFKTTIKDKEVELTVRKPTVKEEADAQKVYRRAFKEGLDNGDLLRVKLDEKLREQGLWDDKKQADYDTLHREINDGEKTLLKGGVKLSDARNLAISIRRKRLELLQLYRLVNSLNELTCEAQAENARFNYLIATCTVYKDSGKAYFKDYAALLNSGPENDGVINEAGTALMKLLQNFDEDTEANLVENKFLKKFGFINDDLRLINKDGHLVDTEGRLIDDNGYYVDVNGNRVDKEGSPLTADGEYKVEAVPFLDDDGNPITDVEAAKEDDTQPVAAGGQELAI